MPQVDITIQVETEVVQAVNAWRATQLIDDGTGTGTTVLKYPSNVDLLKHIIQQAILRIVDQSPTAGIQVELGKIEVSKAVIKVIRDGAVT